MRNHALYRSRKNEFHGNKKAAARGFTMIEVMIVVVIIGILAAIAIPAYRKSVQKSNRSLAKSALLDLAGREEKFYSVNYKYTSTATDLFPGTSLVFATSFNVPSTGTPLYTINVPSATVVANSVSSTNVVTPASFIATATPVNAQATDACGTFSLTNTGLQSVSGVSTGCW